MTFNEFKQEILDRIKGMEIFPFVHGYVKATTYTEIIQLFKTADNFEWHFNNGILDMALIAEVPTADLEAENIFGGAVSFSDLDNTTIYILAGGELTLTQTGTNRCKVYLFGGEMTATASDRSMIELDSYLNSDSHITASDNAMIYANVRGDSETMIVSGDNTLVKMITLENGYAKFNDSGNTFLNIEAWDNSKVDIVDAAHTKIYRRDNAVITDAP